MKFQLQPYSIHELGQRQNQEDSIFPVHGASTPNDRLFILCDGMGGHEKGEVASATVCEVMSDIIQTRWNPNEPLADALLLEALEEAYNELDAKDNGEEKKMGTTLTLLCLHANGATVAHIGDSRVYQLRPAGYARKENSLIIDKWQAKIVFKTRDHSLVNDLIRIGEITEEEAKNHPQKNVITRAMQPCQERRAKADIAHLTDIQPGDYFYLCSDGMLEQTTDENLLFIITKPDVSDEKKVEMLRNLTEENKDNHTAHLIHINKVEGKPVVAEAAQPSTASAPRGTFVTPNPQRKHKGKKTIIFILCAIIIALLAFVFLHSFSTKSEDEEVTDSVTMVEQLETPTQTPASAEKADETVTKEEANSGTDETTTEESTIEESAEEQPAKTEETKSNPVMEHISRMLPAKPETTKETR